METLYRQVFIKSKGDLPKEDGRYQVCKTSGMFWKSFLFILGDKEYIDLWIDTVSWYLLPIEEQTPTDEEIEEQSEKLHYDNIYGKNGWICGAKWCRSQLTSRESKDKDFDENFKGDDDFVKLYEQNSTCDMESPKFCDCCHHEPNCDCIKFHDAICRNCGKPINLAKLQSTNKQK